MWTAAGGLLLVTSTLALGGSPPSHHAAAAGAAAAGAGAAARAPVGAASRITLPTRPSACCGNKRARGEPPSPLEGLLARRGGIKIRAEPVIQPDSRPKDKKSGGSSGKGADGGKAEDIVGARVSYGADGQRGLRMDVDVDVNELTNSLGPAAKPIVAVAKFVQQTIFFTAPVLALAGLITQIAGITCSRYTKTQADKKKGKAGSSGKAPSPPAPAASSKKAATAGASSGGYFDFLWRTKGGAFDAANIMSPSGGGSAAGKNVVVDWPAVGSLAGRAAAQWAWLMALAFALGKAVNQVERQGLKGGRAVDGRLLAAVDVAGAFGAIFLSERVGFLKSKMDMKWYHNVLRKPTWTPKPIVFPLVWIPLKSLQTAALALVWRDVGRNALTPAVAAFVLHLCLGDLWNVVFFGERRIGAGLSVIYAFYGSLAASLYAFYSLNRTAFALLAPTAVWVFIATSLNYSIHLMNGQEPLYPFKKRPPPAK